MKINIERNLEFEEGDILVLESGNIGIVFSVKCENSIKYAVFIIEEGSAPYVSEFYDSLDNIILGFNIVRVIKSRNILIAEL